MEVGGLRKQHRLVLDLWLFWKCETSSADGDTGALMDFLGAGIIRYKGIIGTIRCTAIFKGQAQHKGNSELSVFASNKISSFWKR